MVTLIIIIIYVFILIIVGNGVNKFKGQKLKTLKNISL